ncbi:hypothetical protein Hanom_Chr00s000004g01606981 [Helianthus anomalus]
MVPFAIPVTNVTSPKAASIVGTVTATTTRKSKQSLLPPLFAYNQVLKETSWWSSGISHNQ